MRIALLAFALLAPAALAQVPLVLLEATLDPFPAQVKPLQGPVTTTLHVRAACSLAQGTAGVVVEYAAGEGADWAGVHVSPSRDVLPVTSGCEDGWTEGEATVTVNATDAAPAFRPAPIEVVVRVPEAQERARATTNVTAAFFSILDVSVQEAIVTVPPGASHAFELAIENRGNGATRVTLEAAARGEGLTVDVPEPFVLGSRQQGSAEWRDRVEVVVSTAARGGIVNEVGTIDVRIASVWAEDPSIAGDGTTVSLLVTTRSKVLETPAGGLLALAAALSLGAAIRRR